MTLKALTNKIATSKSCTPAQFDAWAKWITRCYRIFD